MSASIFNLVTVAYRRVHCISEFSSSERFCQTGKFAASWSRMITLWSLTRYHLIRSFEHIVNWDNKFFKKETRVLMSVCHLGTKRACSVDRADACSLRMREFPWYGRGGTLLVFDKCMCPTIASSVARFFCAKESIISGLEFFFAREVYVSDAPRPHFWRKKKYIFRSQPNALCGLGEIFQRHLAFTFSREPNKRTVAF